MAMQRIEELDKDFHFKASRKPGTFDMVYGTLETFLLEYKGAKASTVYTLHLKHDYDAPKEFERSLFILDDGYSVKPYYVAGFNPDKTSLFIHPVSSGMTQYMEPRKTYFLTLTNKGK